MLIPVLFKPSESNSFLMLKLKDMVSVTLSSFERNTKGNFAQEDRCRDKIMGRNLKKKKDLWKYRIKVILGK